MLKENFKNYLEGILKTEISKVIRLTGGDINKVYKLSCSTREYVIKVNSADKYPNMFALEKQGLTYLKDTNTFRIPNIIQEGAYESQSYLILEYIASVKKKNDFSEVFGKNLADMHRFSSFQFGFKNDNYIGSLEQKNNSEASAVDFYINQRLKPQFNLAFQKGFSFDDIDKFYENVRTIIPFEKPALIHGDLWSGNFMIDDEGLPCLLDPAVSFAPREMDIALMHLFGGFDSKIFSSYNTHYPLINGWKERLRLWQLYYILVHLNLFGGHYYHYAKTILKEYNPN